MSRLRLAVIGAGHLGRIHARLAAAASQVQLTAVVDPVPSAREGVAREFGAEPLADCRELFGQVDAAIVATPTSNHFHVASELLRGGVHVLVEKPITADLDEADQLVRLAKQRQLVLQVGHVERFNPGLAAVEEKLYDPKFIEARRLSGYTFRATDVGVVLDLMIHDIDVVLNLVRSPVEHVEAIGVSVLGDHEDMVNARLHFASGCVANLTASRVSYVSQRTMQVFTSQCCATIDFAARRASLVQPSEAVLDRSFRLKELSPSEQEHLREHFFTDLVWKHDLPALEVNAIEAEQLDFATAIRTGVQPRVTGNDGRDALSVAQMILTRIASHQWDGLPEGRRGPLAMPESPQVLPAADNWSLDDTVVIRRKAG
jgi:predicted dehydrogenase